MKYIITESSRHKLINFYLDSLNMKVESDNLEIFVHDATNDEYNGMFNYDYSEDELAIDPFLISIVSGMFNMDRGQAMEGIAIWFEDKFDVTILSAREWDW
jgi:hypothetical protein